MGSFTARNIVRHNRGRPPIIYGRAVLSVLQNTKADEIAFRN